MFLGALCAHGNAIVLFLVPFFSAAQQRLVGLEKNQAIIGAELGNRIPVFQNYCRLDIFVSSAFVIAVLDGFFGRISLSAAGKNYGVISHRQAIPILGSIHSIKSSHNSCYPNCRIFF